VARPGTGRRQSVSHWRNSVGFGAHPSLQEVYLAICTTDPTLSPVKGLKSFTAHGIGALVYEPAHPAFSIHRLVASLVMASVMTVVTVGFMWPRDPVEVPPEVPLAHLGYSAIAHG
jgi:hypothetical protein